MGAAPGHQAVRADATAFLNAAAAGKVWSRVLPNGSVGQFRFVGPQDAGTVTDFLRGLPPSVLRSRFGTPGISETGVQRFLQPGTMTLMISIDGRPAGLMDCVPGNDPTALEFGILIDPRHRNGAGQALFQEMAAINTAQGYQRLKGDVHVTNSRALAFYENLGANIGLPDRSSGDIEFTIPLDHPLRPVTPGNMFDPPLAIPSLSPVERHWAKL